MNLPCTCPSGDGSLHWPCPAHPPTSQAKIDEILRALDHARGLINQDNPEPPYYTFGYVSRAMRFTRDIRDELIALKSAAPVSAEPVALTEPQRNGVNWAIQTLEHRQWSNDLYLASHLRQLLAAPVAALPDITQQTLDDVMAGIPARDAEIVALRKEIEALQAAQSQHPVSAADRLPIELRGISKAINNGGGLWRSCSGCHETNEGMATGTFSETLKCILGVGCSECGGIGATWDTTDYDAMGDFIAAKYQQDVAIDAARKEQK